MKNYSFRVFLKWFFLHYIHRYTVQ
jgi:hypothetical protein